MGIHLQNIRTQNTRAVKETLKKHEEQIAKRVTHHTLQKHLKELRERINHLENEYSATEAKIHAFENNQKEFLNKTNFSNELLEHTRVVNAALKTIRAEQEKQAQTLTNLESWVAHLIQDKI